MSIYEKFESKEALLEAVGEQIRRGQEEETGKEVFFLEREDGDGELGEIQRRLETETAASSDYEKRWRESETALAELKAENARLTATNEEFSKYNPEKQRDEINRLLGEIGRLKADNKGLTDKIAPLNEMIAEYTRKEDERTIEKALREEAAKLGVRPEAMRDVMFRRSMLKVSDLGTVQTEDGVGVAEFLKSEFEASPLWHPLSENGGSRPGTGGRASNEELYREAVKNGDFEGMLTHAPEFKGVTLS